jgi:hypothetical protein
VGGSELHLNFSVKLKAPYFIFRGPCFETSAFCLVNLNEGCHASVEVLTEETVSWDVKPCNLVGVFCSEGNRSTFLQNSGKNFSGKTLGWHLKFGHVL